ncbi:MAG: DUF1549 domain-containing protein [Gemmataceae bacterium]
MGRFSSQARGRRFLRWGILAGVVVLLTQLSAATSQAQAPKGAAFNPASDERVRFIDEKIAEQWKANKITPSREVTDYEFIRRASLDIIGRIATIEEIDRFMKDPPQYRRALLVERLLASNDYNKYWSQIWATWLLTRSGNRFNYEQMRAWLESQLAKDVPYNQMVTELLSTTGETEKNGASFFILSHLGEPIPAAKSREEGQFDMVPITSRSIRLFLGYQIQCTQCHDHPFNPEWGQKHFWGINAFFRQARRDGVPLPAKLQAKTPVADKLGLRDDVGLNSDGIVYYERRNGVILPTKPKFLDGTDIPKDAKNSRREILANKIVNHDNFGKAFVNRMWGHFFGRGLNEQPAVDDFGEHNQLVHPELLDKLADEFIGSGGQDPKNLIRWICNSKPYQLSTVANPTNDSQDAEVFFSRMLLKSMSPEQLYDSLMAATGQKGEDREAFLRSLIINFGDDEGNEATFNGTVVQALMLMNGREINDVVMSNGGTVTKAVAKKQPKLIMDHLFLATLNRPSSPKEFAEISQKFRMRIPDRNPNAAWQDLFWALLNSNEFFLNH